MTQSEQIWRITEKLNNGVIQCNSNQYISYIYIVGCSELIDFPFRKVVFENFFGTWVCTKY